jgi:hypothetical protein
MFALGHASSRRLPPSIPMMRNRRLLVSARRGSRTTQFRPCEDLVTVVHDAATMPPERRSFVAPTQVVECAPIDAKELGGFVDGKEGIVGFIGHRILPSGRPAVLRILANKGSDSDGTPSAESHLPEKGTVPAPRKLEPASKVMTHASFESCLPIPLDIRAAMKIERHFVVAGSCFSPVEGY